MKKVIYLHFMSGEVLTGYGLSREAAHSKRQFEKVWALSVDCSETIFAVGSHSGFSFEVGVTV